MADIFGRERQDYGHIAQIDRQYGDGAWDRHQDALVTQVRQMTGATPARHNFNALTQRAASDTTAVGWISSNMLAIQSYVDEVLYTDYRLPEFLSLNMSVPEGAPSYGFRVQNRVGQAERVSAPGYDAPSATVSEGLVTEPLHDYGLDAIWSISELREAMFAGIPLDTESIDAAVRGSMETMERVGLLGYGDETGLLNHPTSGANAVNRVNRTAEWDDSDGEAIYTSICDNISWVIENSKETLGRNISTGMSVWLPGAKYDLLTSRFLGDDANRTLFAALMQDNPWTHFTRTIGNPGGSALQIHRVLELVNLGEGGQNRQRMVVGLKHPRVAEMGVAINPRVLRILDKGRVVCAQVESRYSKVFFKRPDTVRYVDGI